MSIVINSTYKTRSHLVPVSIRIIQLTLVGRAIQIKAINDNNQKVELDNIELLSDYILVSLPKTAIQSVEFLSAKEAYFKDMGLDGAFDQVERLIAISYSDSLSSVLSGLRNDAMLETFGWGENLYFFLKGLAVAGVITNDNVKKALKLFISVDANTFSKYESNQS